MQIFIIILSVLFLDQGSKLLVQKFIPVGGSINLIGDQIRILHVKNSGVAFSLFSDNPIVTIILTIVLLGIISFMLIKTAKGNQPLSKLALSLVLGGGLSNLINRILAGNVTDMFSCFNFAVFNVADIAVCLGAFLLVLAIIRGEIL